MVEKSRRILIMAGGTGGHVFPALAVADVLRERGVDVQWLGTAKGIENSLVPAANIPLHHIDVGGVRGKSSFAKLLAPLLIVKSILQALVLIKRLQPQVVLGMGGYAAGPGGIAAWLKGITLFIHEQNAAAGTTNKILRRFAKKVFVAFSGALSDSECVGNPVRESICALPSPSERHLGQRGALRVLIVGGSLGAEKLNEVVPQALSQVDGDIEIRHQTGKNTELKVKNCYQSLGLDATVTAFIDNMADAYQWADLLICRAGALTVSEALAAGLPAVFVPYPFAIDDHQTRNAQYAVAQGAALLKPQAELESSDLSKTIDGLNKDRALLIDMANKARQLGITDAAEKVANYCLEVIDE